MEWLTLQDYSNKYKVSISTLRRRIKSRDLEYVFKKGRYLVQDAEDNGRESLSLKELKTLYETLLSDKDFQIQELHEAVEDLKNLVLLLEKEKVLETEEIL